MMRWILSLLVIGAVLATGPTARAAFSPTRSS